MTAIRGAAAVTGAASGIGLGNAEETDLHGLPDRPDEANGEERDDQGEE